MLNPINKISSQEVHLNSIVRAEPAMAKLATSVFKHYVEPQGYGRRFFGLFRTQTPTNSKKESVEAKLKELHAIALKAKGKVQDLILAPQDKELELNYELFQLRFEIMLLQWDILEELYLVLDGQNSPDTAELKQNVYSQLKDIIVASAQEIDDPFLSSEEVVGQMIDHLPALQEQVRQMKELLHANVEEDITDLLEGTKAKDQDEYTALYQAQAARVERWSLEHRLAVQIQRELSLTENNHPLSEKRKLVLDNLHQQHERLKEIKKDLTAGGYTLPEGTYYTDSHELWMLSDYGQILLEKDKNDLYQQSFDEGFRKTVATLKQKKGKIKEEISAIEEKRSQKITEMKKTPALEHSDQFQAELQQVEKELEKKRQEHATAKVMLRYTLLKRTVEKIGDTQNHLNHVQTELEAKQLELDTAQAMLYLLKNPTLFAFGEPQNPGSYHLEAWKKALGSYAFAKKNGLGADTIKGAVLKQEVEVAKLIEEVKKAKDTVALLPEKLKILNDNFSSQLEKYRAIWKNEKEDFLQNAMRHFWNRLRSNLSFGYLAEQTPPTPQDLVNQLYYANMGYSMKEEIWKLLGEIKKSDKPREALKDLYFEFVEWAGQHPQAAARMSCDIVHSCAILSGKDKALTLASGIKTKVLVHSVLRQMTFVETDQLEAKEELKFRALADLFRYFPKGAQYLSTARNGVQNTANMGAIAGLLTTLFGHVFEDAINDTIQKAVEEIDAIKGEQALRIASYIDYIFLQNAYVDSAARIQNLRTTQRIAATFGALNNPKQFFSHVKRSVVHWWKRLNYYPSLPAKLAHAAPAVATVAAIGLTVAAIFGGPITWGIALTAWGMYGSFILYGYPQLRENMATLNLYKVENRILHEDVKEHLDSQKEYKSEINREADETINKLRKQKTIPEVAEDKLSAQAKRYIQSPEYARVTADLKKEATDELKKALEAKKAGKNYLTTDEVLYVLRDSLLFKDYSKFSGTSTKQAETLRLSVREAFKLQKMDIDLNDRMIIPPQKQLSEELYEEVIQHAYTDVLNGIINSWLKSQLCDQAFNRVVKSVEDALRARELGQVTQPPEGQLPDKAKLEKKLNELMGGSKGNNKTVLSGLASLLTPA